MRCKTERHQIRHGQPEYDKLSQIGEYAKNLRNVIVWYTRQHFFNKSGKDYTEDVFSDVKYKYLNYYTLYKYVKEQNIPEFRMLPANVAQDIIRRVVRALRQESKREHSRHTQDRHQREDASR